MTEPSSDSVFYRVDDDLVEIDAAGLVPREVHLTSDGRPKRACGPGEPTRWGDEIGSEIAQLRPGTPAFEHAWNGLGTRITREEFEAAFAAGKERPLRFARYPHRDQAQELGGCLVIAALGFVALLGVLFAMAIFVELLWAAGSRVFGLSS